MAAIIIQHFFKFEDKLLTMKKLVTILFVNILLTFTAVAQNSGQPELESGTIESQFDYIITKSTSFKDFQLIRKPSILKVKKNTLDSLKSISEKYNTAKASIPPLKTEISNLQTEIVTLKQDVETAALGRDSINFLGNPLNKTSYNTFVWSLIAVLVAALLFFVLQFKNSHSVTKKAKSEAELVEQNLEDFKKKAMKKEQELMRKLQDELNKNS